MYTRVDHKYIFIHYRLKHVVDMTMLCSIVHVAIFYGEYQIHDQDQVGIFIFATASHIQHIVLVTPKVDSFGPVTAMNAECI